MKIAKRESVSREWSNNRGSNGIDSSTLRNDSRCRRRSSASSLSNENKDSSRRLVHTRGMNADAATGKSEITKDKITIAAAAAIGEGIVLNSIFHFGGHREDRRGILDLFTCCQRFVLEELH